MPAISAVITANANQMAAEFARAQAMGQRLGTSLQTVFNGRAEGGGEVGSKTIALRELLVLMREMGRGNWTRIPGSLSILISQFGFLTPLFKGSAGAAREFAHEMLMAAAKSEAAAVAANAVVAANKTAMETMRSMTAAEILAMEADRVRAVQAGVAAAADRAKALAAYEAADALKAQGVAARLLTSPLTYFVLALLAVGTAAFFVARHLKELREQEKFLRDLADTTSAKFTDQASAMRETADETQGLRDRLAALGESQEGLAEKTEVALKALREQAKLERSLAVEKGASRQKLAQMDIATAQKELAVYEAAKAVADEKVKQDQASASAAIDENDAFERENRGRGKTLGRKSEAAGQLVDAIEEAMKDARVKFIDPVASRMSAVAGGTGPVYTSRAANADDQLTVKVAGKEITMSLNQAMKLARDIMAEEEDLARTQKSLKDLAEQKTKLTEKDLADQGKLGEHVDELKADLELKKKLLPAIADATDAAKARMAHGSVSSLQQVGAYTSPAVQVDLQRVANEHLRAIRHNTAQHNTSGDPSTNRPYHGP